MNTQWDSVILFVYFCPASDSIIILCERECENILWLLHSLICLETETWKKIRVTGALKTSRDINIFFYVLLVTFYVIPFKKCLDLLLK